MVRSDCDLHEGLAAQGFYGEHTSRHVASERHGFRAQPDLHLSQRSRCVATGGIAERQ